MYHAHQARTGKSPGAEGFPNTEEHRAKWVAMMVEEEVVGTAKGFEPTGAREPRVRQKNNRPAGMGTYRRVFEYGAPRRSPRGRTRSRPPMPAGRRRWSASG